MDSTLLRQPAFQRRHGADRMGNQPDIKVNMDEADEAKHIDTIIEKARAFLKGEWTPAVSE